MHFLFYNFLLLVVIGFEGKKVEFSEYFMTPISGQHKVLYIYHFSCLSFLSSSLLLIFTEL